MNRCFCDYVLHAIDVRGTRDAVYQESDCRELYIAGKECFLKTRAAIYEIFSPRRRRIADSSIEAR